MTLEKLAEMVAKGFENMVTREEFNAKFAALDSKIDGAESRLSARINALLRET